MKPRVLLIAAAAAVVLLAVGLLFLMRESEPGHPASGTSAAPPAPAAPPAADRPAVPPAGSPPILSSEPRTIVRDHRGEEPNAPPSPIVPVTMAEVRQVLGPQIKACAQTMKEPKASRIVVHARIRVGGGRVTASEITVSDPDDLGESYVACIQRAYAELSTDPQADQKDGEDLVHMPWTVP